MTREEVQQIAQEFSRSESIALAMMGRLGSVKLTRKDLAYLGSSLLGEFVVHV